MGMVMFKISHKTKYTLVTIKISMFCKKNYLKVIPSSLHTLISTTSLNLHVLKLLFKRIYIITTICFSGSKYTFMKQEIF